MNWQQGEDFAAQLGGHLVTINDEAENIWLRERFSQWDENSNSVWIGLNDFATEPENIYAHPWAVGETVIWDNRCILHRGTGYDADKWRRLLRQTRVVGEHTGVTL